MQILLQSEHPQHTPNLHELYMSDRELDLERVACSKQLHSVPGLVETTAINH